MLDVRNALLKFFRAVCEEVLTKSFQDFFAIAHEGDFKRLSYLNRQFWERSLHCTSAGCRECRR